MRVCLTILCSIVNADNQCLVTDFGLSNCSFQKIKPVNVCFIVFWLFSPKISAAVPYVDVYVCSGLYSAYWPSCKPICIYCINSAVTLRAESRYPAVFHWRGDIDCIDNCLAFVIVLIISVWSFFWSYMHLELFGLHLVSTTTFGRWSVWGFLLFSCVNG